jgi:hypothetical protein
MSARTEIRSYDYVNQPYERVRDTLQNDPGAVFSDATRAATARASSVASELRVNIGGLDVGTEIAVNIGEIEHRARDSRGGPVTRIPVQWHASRRAQLFPVMSAELSIYPLTATETQLDFLGSYDPPLGAFGDAVDALVGRRIAEASVHRFLSDVAAYLRQNLQT